MTLRASPSTQSGNVIFILFLALVLFAALGFAISRSSVGPQHITSEKNRMAVMELINYTQQISETMKKLNLRGCGVDQFSFASNVHLEYPGGAPISNNPSAPTDYSCHVFHPKGGNLKPFVPSLSLFTTRPAYQTAIPGMRQGGFYVDQLNGLGSTFASGESSEGIDIFYALFYVSKDICNIVNSLSNVTPTPQSIILNTYSGSVMNSFFDGTLESYNKKIWCQTMDTDIGFFGAALLIR